LLAYRALSNQVAQDFGVIHESPQVILVREGKVVYHESHYGISYAALMAQNG
jgi:bacillithiol system protein YtxJ